jgi:peptide/nickel transport system substrate-binding protein
MPNHIQGSARPRARVTVIAVLSVLAIATVACGSSSPSAAPSGTGVVVKPRSGGTLVVGVRAETNGWNPAKAQWADTGSLEGSTVLEPLATVGADSGAKPWLATDWYPNTTFTKWVVNLQKGVTFQDGEPFNADAAVQSLQAATQGTLSKLAVGPMFQAVQKLSDSSIEIDLTQPWAAFPSSFLMGGSAFMMAPNMLNAPDGQGGSAHPIGTGPFTFDSWQSGDSFKVKRNPTYWGGLDAKGKRRTGQGLPYLDAITFRVIAEDGTRTSSLQSGDLNMEYTTNAGDANKLAGEFTVLKDWTTEDAFVMPNTSATVGGKPNPLNDIHARMALAYATNRDQIAKQIGDGVQVPTSPWSPTNPWGMPDSENGYVKFDLTKAKSEVAAYEHDTGQSSLSFTLSGLPSIDDAKILQLLQGQWKSAGISVNIETLEQTAYITKIATGGFQAAFFRNYGYPDPDQDYYFWSNTTIAAQTGGVSINFTQFTTPQIQQDINAGRTSGFANQRKTAYNDLVKQLNASATNIWMYRTPYSFIAQKKVQGLYSTGGPSQIPFGNFSPKTWWSQIWLQS